jgi:hypothetical protein
MGDAAQCGNWSSATWPFNHEMHQARARSARAQKRGFDGTRPRTPVCGRPGSLKLRFGQLTQGVRSVYRTGSLEQEPLVVVIISVPSEKGCIG